MQCLIQSLAHNKQSIIPTLIAAVAVLIIRHVIAIINTSENLV